MKNKVLKLAKRLGKVSVEDISQIITTDEKQLEEILQELLSDKEQMILVYCRSGRRATDASIKLAKMGYVNVYNFGGIVNWPYEIVK